MTTIICFSIGCFFLLVAAGVVAEAWKAVEKTRAEPTLEALRQSAENRKELSSMERALASSMRNSPPIPGAH